MRLILTVALHLLLVFANAALAQEGPLNNIEWQEGPGAARLGDIAEIQIPEGFVFAGSKDTKTLMESMQNPISGSELGFLAPDGASWFMVFEFDKTGYIRDDEKGKLDPAAMLESIQKGTEEGNKMRRKRGWAEMTILGWVQEPHYDTETNNLEWAIRAESEGSPIINYNTRILGREGVMRITLVTDPTEMLEIMPEFKEAIAGFDFLQGKRYAEFKKGDKVAEYGLSALVVGGAAAVAAKTGIFKYIWKLLILAAMGIAAFFKKIVAMFKSEQKS